MMLFDKDIEEIKELILEGYRWIARDREYTKVRNDFEKTNLFAYKGKPHVVHGDLMFTVMSTDIKSINPELFIGVTWESGAEELQALLIGHSSIAAVKSETPKLPLRKCKFLTYILDPSGTGASIQVEKNGLFHEWGSDYEEFDDGAGNYSVGIVEEEETGQVFTPYAHHVKFVTKPGEDE